MPNQKDFRPRVTRADVMTVGAVAEMFGLTRATVTHAVRRGRVRAIGVRTARGGTQYLIRPSDAASVWGAPAPVLAAAEVETALALAA